MSHATSRTERMDMDEDDSDSEDMGERNVEDEYYDEAVDMLQKAFNDSTVFRTLTQELEDSRKSYEKLSTSVANKLVMKALIMLPCVMFPRDDYKKQLSRIIRKFEVIFVQFSKWEEDSQNYVLGAEDAIAVLTKNAVLSTRKDIEWLIDIVTDMGKINLKSIIPKLEKGEFDQNFFNDKDSQLPKNIDTEMENLAERVSNEDPSASTSAITESQRHSTLMLHHSTEKRLATHGHEVVEVLCNISRATGPAHPSEQQTTTRTVADGFVQFSDVFTHKGGELRHRISDNFLRVPSGAIPRGQKWRIRGRIHTQLDKFLDHFLQSDQKQFRSSIMEFTVIEGNEQKLKFSEPVSITIRHSASSDAAKENLKVFCLEDDGETIEIKKRKVDTDGQPSFIVNGEYVEILTYQFCHYTCVCSKPFTNVEIERLYAIAYGKLYSEQEDNLTHKAIIDIALWVLVKDDPQILPEFRETYALDKKEQGMQFLFWEPLDIPNRDLQCENQLQIRLLIASKSWQLNLINESSTQVIKVRSVFDCAKKAKNDVRCKNSYVLQGTTTSLTAAFDFSFLPATEDASNRFSFNIKCSNEQKEQVTQSTKQLFTETQGVSDDKLWDIAKKNRAYQHITSWFEVGIAITRSYAN